MTEKSALKSHRLAHREYVKHNEKKQNNPDQQLKQVDPIAFNQSAEIQAVKFLIDYIAHKGAPRFNTACDLIALELDVSTETAKRYLRKYSVDHPKAVFEIRDGYVTLRRNGQS